MPVTLTQLSDLATLGFDAIIDVRAPAEYAEDHLPGAISLPVLSDAERAEVGTIYKQESPFKARKVGGALVAANAAKHLQGPLADKEGGWRPLVYCWRGGQRSGSFATILSQVGWRVDTIAGGYRAWRGLVVQALYHAPFRHRLILLDGNTGSAKTELLARMAAKGAQVIDLERLARHRGSLFGAMPGGQPSQKAFEGALALELARLDPARPVLVEAESAKIGSCRLPPRLWQAMQVAPRLSIAAAASERAAYLCRSYADLTSDRDRLVRIVASLRPLHAAEQIDEWIGLAERGDFPTLAEGLMIRHYDPRYTRHRARAAVPVIDLTAQRLDESGLVDLTERLMESMARLAVQ
ncbi:tRNA 2-selenouridine(34) synthase MnmH [Neogemmobacter tilapiae]|uniref:tRNA 2-selenouridine synthase n=1 Tax=Neogemmobacter tilapiae TaxID=875041 RepID=A0A918WL05_9RHOB|nr:tRNA 2-selenouridine(34) synthase MnmH [Gemmobacter tilapiae]GHC61280.1 tRNA 2-selenouridine synthase [Gemmobacter tilapiae]